MRWIHCGRWEAFLAPDGTQFLRPTVELEPYEIRSFPEVDNALDRLDRFWRANNPLSRGVAARFGKMIPPLEDELVALLDKLGPLRQLQPSTYTNGFNRKCPRRSIQVDELMLDIRVVAETWRSTSSRPTGIEREKTADILAEYGLRVLQLEMELTPRFRNGQFGYDIAPVSLRALLWERLFRVFDRALRAVCRYCAEVFEPEPTPGRAYQYCPAHRTAGCRQAVLKKRAPAYRFPGRFDLINGGISNG